MLNGLPSWHHALIPLSMCSFLKIPLRPKGTEDWTEEQLQSCVTRDSIVGVAWPKSAEQVTCPCPQQGPEQRMALVAVCRVAHALTMG